MFTIILRVIIIYVFVLFFLRIMGKRQIGEMQPFELVITLIIADLATVPMADSSIPLINGIVPLAVLVVLHFILTFLSRKSIVVRKILSGEPIIVMTEKGINYKNLTQLNMTIDDLYEGLRGLGYYKFDQVQYAIVETNGKLSVIPTAESANATASDLDVKNEETTMPFLVITDGQLNKENLKSSGKSFRQINNILKTHKIPNIKEVVVLSIDGSNTVYLQQKNKKFLTFTQGE